MKTFLVILLLDKLKIYMKFAYLTTLTLMQSMMACDVTEVSRNMLTAALQVHTFLTNLQELLKGADELGYRRRVFQKSSTTISLI